MTPEPTTKTRLALIEQSLADINDKLDEMISYQREQDGRVRQLEQDQIASRAKIEHIPERVAALEMQVAEARGAAQSGQLGGAAGGIALVVQLIQIIAGLVGGK